LYIIVIDSSAITLRQVRNSKKVKGKYWIQLRRMFTFMKEDISFSFKLEYHKDSWMKNIFQIKNMMHIFYYIL